MKGNKKRIVYGALILAVLGMCYSGWSAWISPTRIAFVNYQITTLGEISKANDNSFIQLHELKTEELDNLANYDMVFVNAMGLRITQEQRQLIQDAADNGLAILTTAATNPENDITSVDSLTEDELIGYIGNGGRKNYRSLLRYVRKYIDGKKYFADAPDELAQRDNSLLYHSDPKHPEEENQGFKSVTEYDSFLKKNHLYKQNNPRIIVTGQMGDPTDLIQKLEATGNMVYAVRDIQRFVQKHHIDSVQPSAIINLAHGRMGDNMVDYLTKQNIPLFAPLNVNRLIEDWETDKMGMNGGFMSQSIVTPELDGAIRPYVLFGHRLNVNGMEESYIIPERLESFVATVNQTIALKQKSNRDKRVVIYYYKGPGQETLTATGMEVVPSLFNLLSRMRQEGYDVSGLPQSSDELEKMLQKQGAVFATYHQGAFDDFMKTGNPLLVNKEEYEQWVKKALRPAMYQEVTKAYGEFPGEYMATSDGQLGIARIQFGNVVLLPQNMAGIGDNSFAIVHGTDAAPPHPYIASYLWAQFGFKADVMVHFGTHGSLEFTPRKQVALCNNDWPDRLVGTLPHLYIYSMDDVGEGMIAKRRSYATLQSHLTPPFLQSEVRGIYNQLNEAIKIYNQLESKGNAKRIAEASLKVKALAVKLGIHRELGLDSVLTQPYTATQLSHLEEYAEELGNEKITGELYTLGQPYETERITSSVYAMATEPIAYSLLALDKQRKKMDADVEKHRTLFTLNYLNPARDLVTRLLANPSLGTDPLVCQLTGITLQQLNEARAIELSSRMPQDMMQAMSRQINTEPGNEKPESKTASVSNEKREWMRSMGSGMNSKMALKMAKTMGTSSEDLKKMEKAMSGNRSGQKSSGMMQKMEIIHKSYTKEQRTFAHAVMEVERTVKNVGLYRTQLLQCPEAELVSFLNALNGGYTCPSSGGDPITNPLSIPTGRNLYAINAENTPSESAWEKGKELADNTIRMYRKRHNDSIPRKVGYTLWSGEFIETEGATLAQVLYMLGVEPVRDVFGRVTDLRLIPSAELGRPRIDVVVQTSGQLRDIAASRLFLINRAVEMAAAAKDKNFENQVATGLVEAERVLIDKGLSPKEAREASAYRVFGGVNGSYGTGIQGMVMASNQWNSEQQIADVYLNNMGSFYGDEKKWEQVQKFAFEAALTRTDAMIQPRQSNTWGALSLDHVYEFMGGMNLAVRNVTGKDPDAYLSDYRNHNHMRMQEVKEAIGVESRTTLFNPTYIKEKMKGGSSSAHIFADVVQNTFGWNVMKPQTIDKEMWDEIYNVYVKDKFNLGMKSYFEEKNQAALQDMSATMLEAVRKGMWKASEGQIRELAELHTELVNKYRASGSSMSMNNPQLQNFIASKVDVKTAKSYEQQLQWAKSGDNNDNSGTVMKKEELRVASDSQTQKLSNSIVVIVIVMTLMVILVWIRKRRHLHHENDYKTKDY